MLKNTLKIFILFISVYLISFSFVSFAKNKSENAGNPSGENKQAQEEKKAQNQIRNCEQVAERTKLRAGEAGNSRQAHERNYGAVASRLSEVIVAMEAEGLDTSALSTDLATFEAMVEEYKSLFGNFVGSLGEYANQVCGEGGQGYKGILQAAKGHHLNVIAKRKAIREFYGDFIREDVKDLREQFQSLNQEDLNE